MMVAGLMVGSIIDDLTWDPPEYALLAFLVWVMTRQMNFFCLPLLDTLYAILSCARSGLTILYDVETS